MSVLRPQGFLDESIASAAAAAAAELQRDTNGRGTPSPSRLPGPLSSGQKCLPRPLSPTVPCTHNLSIFPLFVCMNVPSWLKIIPKQFLHTFPCHILRHFKRNSSVRRSSLNCCCHWCVPFARKPAKESACKVIFVPFAKSFMQKGYICFFCNDFWPRWYASPPSQKKDMIDPFGGRNLYL